MSDTNTKTDSNNKKDSNVNLLDSNFPVYDSNKLPFPNDGFQPSSCGNSYDDLLSQEGLFNKAIESSKSAEEAGLQPSSCKTANMQDSSAISGSVLGGVGPKLSGSNTFQASVSSGCSALAVQYALNENLTNSLNCTCQTLQNESSDKAGSVQKLKLVIKDATVKGNATFNISQGSTTTAQIIDFTSADVQTKLSNSMKASLNSLNKSAQSKKVTGSTNFTSPSAQKSLQDAVSAVVASSATTLNSDIINKTIQSVCNVQDETLYIIGSTFDSNLDVNSLQNSSINYVTKNIAKAVVGSLMQNSTLSSQIQKTVQTQKTIKKKEEEKKKQSSFWDWIILIIVLVLLMFFSIDQYHTDKISPKIRFALFWAAFLSFAILFIISSDKDKKGFWISGLILFAVATALNFSIINKNSTELKFGNGMKYVFKNVFAQNKALSTATVLDAQTQKVVTHNKH